MKRHLARACVVFTVAAVAIVTASVIWSLKQALDDRKRHVQ